MRGGEREEGLPWTSCSSGRTCGLAGWESFVSRRGGWDPAEKRSARGPFDSPALATYHILPRRKPRPSFLVNGHICVVGGRWGRNLGGLCGVGLLHIDEEFVLVARGGERGRFRRRDRLGECCRRRHRNRFRMDCSESRLECAGSIPFKCGIVIVGRSLFFTVFTTSGLGSLRFWWWGSKFVQKIVDPPAKSGLIHWPDSCLSTLTSLQSAGTQRSEPAQAWQAGFWYRSAVSHLLLCKVPFIVSAC